ncbi:MAG: hypothetical protein SFU91_06270 [Chloroherpetonaceae bacterium]|nr:hypothetical protein [Chloroherpetonaceae bacterium]
MSILKYLFMNVKKTITLQLKDIYPCDLFSNENELVKIIPSEYKNKTVGNSGIIIDLTKNSLFFYFDNFIYSSSINDIKMLSILLTGNDPDRGNRCTFSKLILYKNNDSYLELFSGALEFDYRLSELKNILNTCDIQLKIEDNPSDTDYLIHDQGMV